MPIYLKFDSIDGDVTAKGFEKSIEVLSFSWGVTNSGSIATGSGGGAGKASFQDLHFVQKTGSASPKLIESGVTGQAIKEATMTFIKAGSSDNPQAYLQIKMNDVLISGFQTAGAEGAENDIPTDEVSLNFAKIEYDFTPQNTDGSIGAVIPFNFDLRLGQ
jgi:type VI secretion system secreted protein Hcp